MRFKHCILLLSLVLVGCGVVSSSLIESKSDPRNPIDRSAKIWIATPQDETFDERLIRYKVESVMKSLGYSLVPHLADSEYMLVITAHDSRRTVTSTNTTTNIVALPSGNGGTALMQTQATPSSRTIADKELYFEIGRTEEYHRYLETKEIPKTLWEGRIGLTKAAFEAYGEKAIRELFEKFPNDRSGYYTLGPRVW